MTTRRIYLILAVMSVLAFLTILPLIETVVGIVLLLGFMLYSVVAVHLGAPVLSCGQYCGR